MAVLELAIYTINPEALGEVWAPCDKMRRALSRWEGFLSGRAFQPLENTDTFVNYYSWNGMGQALEVVDRIKSEPEVQDFLGFIDELIALRHFGVEGDHPTCTKADKGDVF
jgi:hypothetical protein